MAGKVTVEQAVVAGAVDRETLLAWVSLMVAREIKAFGDLTPIEVEAFLRTSYAVCEVGFGD